MCSCPAGSKSLRRTVTLMKRRTSSSGVQRGKKYCSCVQCLYLQVLSPGSSSVVSVAIYSCITSPFLHVDAFVAVLWSQWLVFYFLYYRRAERKAKHDEIRRKYGKYYYLQYDIIIRVYPWILSSVIKFCIPFLVYCEKSGFVNQGRVSYSRLLLIIIPLQFWVIDQIKG